MMCLFLNTASNYLHVALVADNNLKDEVYEKYDRDLSKMALFRVKELLEKNGLEPNDIDKIYVVRGPGSFTGLRVGVTIAKTYAWGCDKELYSLSNLFVMACSLKGYDYVIPMIDARRGYVYAGIYDKDYNNYMEDKHISLDELKSIAGMLDGSYAFVSLDDFKDIEVINYTPDINNVFSNLRCDKCDYYTFEPEYLKKTEAEENLKNDKGN